MGEEELKKTNSNKKTNVFDVSSTPYDDVFRTLINDCRHLIIPLINEVFEEHYVGDEEVVFSPNEHYLNQQDGREEKRVTDTVFRVIRKNMVNHEGDADISEKTERKFHLETESAPGSKKVLIRIFEYDAQVALDEGKTIEENELVVSFPRSAVIFLRSTTGTPDFMKMTIDTPGGRVSYDIPALKLSDYTLEDIFEKKLYLLIPFYIFNHEPGFKEMENDGEKLKELIGEYEDVKRKLEELVVDDEEAAKQYGGLDEYTRCTIIDMSRKVMFNIAANYENIKKGVEKVMGGQVLDYEAKRILKQGERQGVEQGVKQGLKQGLKQGVEQGVKQGIIGCIEILRDDYNLDEEAIVNKIMKKYNLSEDAARDYVYESEE